MQHLFKFLPEVDSTLYRNYFLNEFMEETNFHKRILNTTYVYFYPNEMNKPMIKKLNEQLQSLYNFPSIEYALVFKHLKTQPIHVDGHDNIRYASLNLPLSGYENTKMVFYKSKINTRDIIPTDAFYFSKDEIEFDAELPGTSDWVLVNSSVPHNIVNTNPIDPRMTICFRFKDNPSFNSLLNLVKSKTSIAC